MKFRVRTLLESFCMIFLLLSSLLFVLPSMATEALPVAPQWFDKHLLVLAAPAATESEIRTAIGKEGQIAKTMRLDQLVIYKVFYESGSAMQVAEGALKKNPQVLAVQKNLISNSPFVSTSAGALPETRPLLESGSVVNDPYFSRQLELSQLHVPSAWRLMGANPTTNTLAVVSTGAWQNSAELDLQGYYDAVSLREGSPIDPLNRGSFLAGIAAAKTNNAIGIVSPARYSSVLAINATASYAYPLGQGNRNGIADDSLIEAISYCARPGRNGRARSPVVLLDSVFEPQYALYNQSMHPVLHMVCRWFHDAKGGMIVCPYSGNAYLSHSQPLSYLTVVANLNAPDDNAISYMLPGSGALSADRSGAPALIRGHEASAALFAGLAAMIWSARPAYSNLDIERSLASSCVKTIAGAGSQAGAVPPGGYPSRRLPGYGMPDAAMALGPSR